MKGKVILVSFTPLCGRDAGFVGRENVLALQADTIALHPLAGRGQRVSNGESSALALRTF